MLGEQLKLLIIHIIYVYLRYYSQFTHLINNKSERNDLHMNIKCLIYLL